MKEMIFTVMPMFVCLFWFVMLALDLIEHRYQHPRMQLLLFMGAATLLYWGHCVFFNRATDLMPISDTLYSGANLAVYPLYYLYISSLTTRRNERRLGWLILIPALLGFITVGGIYLLMSPDESVQFITTYLYNGERMGLTGLPAAQSFTHDICKVLFALQIIPILAVGRQRMRQYEQLLNSLYSDTEGKSLQSLHYMLIAFVVTSVLSFIANIIGRHYFVNSLWLLGVPSTLFSILLFAIGYIGYRQHFSIADIENDEQHADEEMPEQKTIQELRIRVEKIMKEEKLYLQPNLKIVDLVKRLGSNRNYLYQAINRDMGMSFNEYVNRLRIDYAEQLMAQHPEKTLNEICDLSGFTSSTSFYRNFKQFRGVSPKENAMKAKK